MADFNVEVGHARHEDRKEQLTTLICKIGAIDNSIKDIEEDLLLDLD